MTRANRRRNSNTLTKVLVSIVVIAVILVVAAEFGVRSYIKSEITSQINSQAAEAGMSDVEDPSVSFGFMPVLLGLAQKRIPALDIDIPSSLNVVYEDNDKSKPVVKGMPKTTMQGKGLELDLDNDRLVFDELTIDTTMSTDLILSALSSANSGAADDPVAGMISVTDVTPNVENQTLDVEITNGLATMTVKPEVVDGELTFAMDSIKVLGMNMPDSLTQAFGDNLSSSADEQLPNGMKAEEVHITEEGLEMRVHGLNVNFDDVQASLEDTEQGGSQELQGSKNPDAHQPGSVGSGGEIFNSAAAA